MQQDRKHLNLENESLKISPFGVPDGYFEQFPQRMLQRIREREEEAVPVRTLGSGSRFRVAVAAAILVLALVSYPLVRILSPDRGMDDMPEIALIEELIIDDDRYLVGMMETGSEMLDDEEAYANQAMDYLALNDVEMDLILNE
ncbi:MAG: hypothetical protein EHM46_05130 [Bacteroidetes bacterium]|nr:MAG: hypothetical protein EHM46_05130 [Bacteroidota bacterium]